MRTHGLRIRLLSIAIAAGLCITAVLLSLEYLEYRKAVASTGVNGERSLLAAERLRLDKEAHDILAANAAQLEDAVRRGNVARITEIGDTILAVPIVTSIAVLHADGGRQYASEKHDAWVAGLAPEEKLSAERALSSAPSAPSAAQGSTPQAIARIEVGRQGLLESAAGLRTQLEDVERTEFGRWVWIIAAAGLVITAVLTLVAWLLARRLERPIIELIRSAERIGEGDYTRPHAITSNDEMADLEMALDRMRQNLRQTTITKDYLNSVLNSMNDAVLVTSPAGVVTRANDAAVRLFGYKEEEMRGKPFITLIAETERENFSLESSAVETRETVIATRSGQTIPVSLSGAPIAADDPQFAGTIFVVRNITERKRAERRIRYLARYDALTKVPNRMQFQHMLQQAIARARKADRGIVLLYLDMDRFKEINDTFGHAAGDRTLEVLTERLTRILPREAVVGRLAGDEFGLFIEGFSEAEHERTQAANLARMVLAEVGKAYYVDEQEVFLTASVGIALCPKDAENVIDLIRNADAAMYHSKQNGGNSFAFYSPEMNAAAVERLMLRSKLRRALERDELVMFYQPKVDLQDGRIIGAEALLRWRLPGHGDIPPSQFIPLAEETNLILGIGEWVLNRVCADYRRWTERVPNPGRVSINLSLKQLRQASFITRCRAVFRRHEVSPTCFELEITETTLMADPKRTIKLLNELYAMGLHLSIDDFGTGYSSLSALQQFPINTLKIDQSFVRDAAVNPDDATIVRTIIDMGKALEVEVVAEGVENEEQFNLLRARGCHYAQGRLFGDAMSSDEFLGLLQAQASGRSKVSKLFA
ncbi:diguanylate cyclase (GGDEF)-like protein/PAS domain S-box-containing protein [Povalibacter uvarum]|uniref:cyclic-guanylate-specific phosphodiesterase n=1 Tax=Povalibacter uvarum TaxID=732238 RepID=A0A841HJW6_9GAMM|nr:bifunctional diguanylate cyclase/phosphodiesterase [Povalibacter uvarum]MBB6092590.1 diguanylate cyclase (GGDEF)-like protein/PAS domain S-box-containing protein [Povalibacter uvarum]